MKTTTQILSVALFAGTVLPGSVAAMETSRLPVNDKPVWQVVSGLPEAPGVPVIVRSAATNEPIGAFPVDTRFMSFGSNGHIVTTAINGALVYLPASSVSQLYPTIQQEDGAPRGAKSLEERAEEYEERVKGNAEVALRARDSIKEIAAQRMAQSQMVDPNAAAGMDPMMGGMGMGMGMDPNNPQPGAALATGGVQALGGMAGAGGGYMGGANQPFMK